MVPNTGSQMLVAAAVADTIRIFDVISGRCVRTIGIGGHGNFVQIVCLQAFLDPYSKRSVAVAVANSTLTLWELASGDHIRKLVTVIDQKAVKVCSSDI